MSFLAHGSPIRHAHPSPGGAFKALRARLVILPLLAAASVFGPGTAHAVDAGDWLVRLRGLVVAPQDSSSSIRPDLPTARIGVDDSVTGEIDFTYMWTDNVGTELILASPQHDLRGEGGVSALGKIGDSRLLPPVLTLQYHFLPKYWIRPYVGVGVNYTIFYDEHTSTSLSNALGGPTHLSLSDSVGPAGQVGVDVDLTDRIFMNFDVKYVGISTTAKLTTGGTVRKADVDINPILVGFGVGMRF